MDDWYAHWFDADYELLYAHRDHDEARLAVEMALGVAPELGQGPVLDLGCGSGRHLVELRNINPRAFGLDLSGHLLAQAPRELHPWLLRGDMRRLPIRPSSLYGLTLWFTPFGYFSEGENAQLLKNLASVLVPGGVLLLDYFNAARLRETLVEEEVILRDGMEAHVRRSLEGDRVIKRITLERKACGARREVVESVHLYDPPTLELLISGAGLVPMAILGSYTGAPFELALSDRWIGIFRRSP